MFSYQIYFNFLGYLWTKIVYCHILDGWDPRTTRVSHLFLSPTFGAKIWTFKKKRVYWALNGSSFDVANLLERPRPPRGGGGADKWLDKNQATYLLISLILFTKKQ